MLIRNWNSAPESYHKVIKVARTIADLEGEEVIGEGHISEALCYRAGERKGV